MYCSASAIYQQLISAAQQLTPFPHLRYATVDDAIKMVVANKTDLAGRRDVSAEEGHDLAKKHG